MGWKVKFYISAACSYVIGFAGLIVSLAINGEEHWLNIFFGILSLWYLPLLLIMGLGVGGADGNLG